MGRKSVKRRFHAKGKSWIKAVIATLSFLLIIALVVVVFGFIEKFIDGSDKESGTGIHYDATGEVYYHGEKYKLNKDIKTLLLLGIDRKEGESEDRAKSNQADFLILIVVDESQKSYKLIQINRDTMTEIRQLDDYGTTIDKYEAQIALSHAYGGTDKVRGRNVVYSVEKLMYDIDVDYFMSMTMDSIPIFNDGVGGVSVELLDDFSHINPAMTVGTTYTLVGEEALSYVQERKNMDDNTNLSRMERQKQYMSALLGKIGELDTQKVLKLLTDADRYMESNCSANQLTNLFDSVTGYSYEGIVTIKGEAVQGNEYIEYHADENELQKLVVETFYLKAEDK